MEDELVELGGVRLLVRGVGRPPLDDGAAAPDLIGEAVDVRADWVVVALEQLGDRFLDLATGVAGDIVQRFANYGIRLAIVGDIEGRTEHSASLRAFVAEVNRGPHVRFVGDLDELRP